MNGQALQALQQFVIDQDTAFVRTDLGHSGLRSRAIARRLPRNAWDDLVQHRFRRLPRVKGVIEIQNHAVAKHRRRNRQNIVCR